MPDDQARLDPQAADRQKLAEAIEALKEQQQRFEALEAALERNSDEQRELPNVPELEAKLAQAKAGEQRRLAEAVLNGTPDAVSPIPQLQAALDTARAKHQRLEQIRHALDHELEPKWRLLDARERDIRRAVGALIAGSEQFHALLVEYQDHFARLRDLRKTFHLIPDLPDELLKATQREWSLDPDVSPRPTPIQEELFAEWEAAIAAGN
jgi:hypothetical protein